MLRSSSRTPSQAGLSEWSDHPVSPPPALATVWGRPTPVDGGSLRLEASGLPPGPGFGLPGNARARHLVIVVFRHSRPRNLDAE